MKKTIKLTERDLTNLVKRIINESKEYVYNKKSGYLKSIIDDLNNGNIEAPYFHNLRDSGLDDETIQLILKDFFKENFIYGGYDMVLVNGRYENILPFNNNLKVFSYGKPIYEENISSGSWKKYEYDNFGRVIRYEIGSPSYKTYWEESKYNENGKLIYRKTSNDYWEEIKYGKNGNVIYRKDSVQGTTIGKKRDRLEKFNR